MCRPQNYTQVRYEDLCADPVSGFQSLFVATGLRWHEQSDAFVRASTESTSGGYYSVFRNPLDAARSWEQQLAAEDIERVLAITRRSPAGRLYDD